MHIYSLSYLLCCSVATVEHPKEVIQVLLLYCLIKCNTHLKHKAGQQLCQINLYCILTFMKIYAILFSFFKFLINVY